MSSAGTERTGSTAWTERLASSRLAASRAGRRRMAGLPEGGPSLGGQSTSGCKGFVSRARSGREADLARIAHADLGLEVILAGGRAVVGKGDGGAARRT